MLYQMLKPVKDQWLRLIYPSLSRVKLAPSQHKISPRTQAIPKNETFSASYRERVITAAGKILDHQFNLLGRDIRLPKGSLEWNSDFSSNYHWPSKTFYRNITIPYGQADIKAPWELSRFHHLVMLGQAYQLTKDEKYTHESIAQIRDWIEKNPPGSGVNWVCTMDVAIRACNWILAYGLFRDSPHMTEGFVNLFTNSLLIHGRHIKLNLEHAPDLTTNHYLSNIAGLIYISTFLPESSDANHWKEFAVTELKKEMTKQVYPDGSDFEASTCYHRLSLELFFYSALKVAEQDPEFPKHNYAEICQTILGEEYTAKLYKMFEVVLYLLKPDGRMPQIGDNDNGQLHKFLDRDVLDMRYLLTLGSIFFKESKFNVPELGFAEDAYWIFGTNGKHDWDNLVRHSASGIESRSFPDSGWHIMRDRATYVAISCGPNGQNKYGGHSHNDKLSFELHNNGQDILVDPGTYTYTSKPNERNQFRSTVFHNTVLIDGEEQNPIDPSHSSLFILRDLAKAQTITWDTNATRDLFIGEHSGYQRLSGKIVHHREITFIKTGERKLIITDRFHGTGEHTLTWNLNFAPNWQNLDIIRSNLIPWRMEEGWHSPQYGHKQKIKKLTATIKAQLPCEYIFEIALTI